MRQAGVRLGRWIVAACTALALAGCGGGGGGGGAPPLPPPDARNGDYVVAAANAREYTLSLDFDARTYRMSGNGLNETGAFASDANGFHFLPAGVVGSPTNTTRFSQGSDTVIGGFRFPEGVLPFVAPRLFVASIAEGAGVYNFLTRTVDTAAPVNNAIFQGELTSAGQLRTCNDFVIHPISQCPDASVVAGTVTVSAGVFTSTTPAGAFVFRIARIGADKVLLRASPSIGTARRFWVGVPATASFASGSFAGANTDGNWSNALVSSSAHSASIVTPAGATRSRSGTSQPVGAQGLASMLRLSTDSAGSYFAIRASELAVIAAARDSTAAPGFVEIGRRQ